MPRLDAIDLSHWNEVTDWNALAASSILGVIHKATEGTSYQDEDYPSRKAAALEHELAWAAYHFLKHGNIPAQMQWFLDYAQLPPGSRVVIDYEDPACTLEDLREAVEALRYLEPSMQICIYSGSLIKEQLGDKRDELLATTSLWLAQYTANTPTWPKGTWATYSLWQYTDGQAGGHPRDVPGAKLPIDCNTFNGTPEACMRWFGPLESEPTFVMPPQSVRLTVTPGTVVWVNDEEITAR